MAGASNEQVAAVIEEAKAAGFQVEVVDGVPMIPADDLRGSFRMSKALEFVERAATVTGARIFREGIVLEPPRPAKAERVRVPADEPKVGPSENDHTPTDLAAIPSRKART